MDKIITDTNNKLLQEGFYIRTDYIFGNNSLSNIVYLRYKEGRLNQESLESVTRPLQVLERTTFRPLSQKDIDWLKERLLGLEQTIQSSQE